MRYHPIAYVLAAALVASACNPSIEAPADTSSATPIAPAPRPSADRVAFDSIKGPSVVASTLSIRARLLDSAGAPIAKAVVSVVVNGGGVIFAQAIQSSDSGYLADQWTLGIAAGAQSVEMRWVDPNTGIAKSLGQLAVIAMAAPLASISIGTPHYLLMAGAAIAADSILAAAHVRLADQYGNAISASMAGLSASGAALANGSLSAKAAGYSYLIVGSAIKDSIAISAISDLRKQRWALSFACTHSPALDSASFALQSDSLVYMTTIPSTAANATAWLYSHGVERRWKNGAESDTAFALASFHVQRPLGLEIAGQAAQSQPDGSYAGASLCDAAFTGKGATLLAPLP